MTQFNAPTYDISRPTGQCAFTGATLEPGQDYIATLVEMTDEEIAQLAQQEGGGNKGAASLGMKRLDVSMEAWEKGSRPERLFSYWKTVVREPNQKKKLFVDDGVLMSLFARLADTTEPSRLAFRFVLGLILMRKRLLRYDGTIQERDPDGNEQEIWLMIAKGESESRRLLNPHLDQQQTEEVAQQLGEILEAEL